MGEKEGGGGVKQSEIETAEKLVDILLSLVAGLKVEEAGDGGKRGGGGERQERRR